MQKALVLLLIIFSSYIAFAESVEFKFPVQSNININTQTEQLLNYAGEAINSNKLQEAIWVYELLGLTKQADGLKLQLHNILSHAPMTEPLRLTADTLHIENSSIDTYDLSQFKAKSTQVFKVSFVGTGISAVIRPYSTAFGISSGQRDLLAYEIDQIVKLITVPMTIEIDHPKLGKGTLQYFIEGKSGQSYIEQNRPMLNKKGFWDGIKINSKEDLLSLDWQRGYPKGFENLWLLDFLMNQVDRHHDNWLISPAGFIVGTDNQNTGKIIHQITDIIQIPSQKVLSRLSAITQRDFKSTQSDILSVLRQRDYLLKEANSCKKIF